VETLACTLAIQVGKRKVKVTTLDGEARWVAPGTLVDVPCFTALVMESREVGWPEHYHDDLDVHDWNYLAREDAPTRFGWGLRAWGTHLYDPRDRKFALAVLNVN
jgi:hypothetical protein